ncbi:NAD(P)-binding domain-containing protein [Flavobacterium chungbukense]|uniref:Pyrroline-5-carboxylate reductase catalytic N-terminal domain-containing protein n=1 Tax=Flavobacterium chungbukense TaxID=877464 RepID=A0ABP7YF35_9FLAO|nr:NAD(P)-binding domain-containing protein [Flavobacterium chungbukense]MCC4920586.1 NAD(P)-binding domain-containing protein [Flavobacterium chungbukense]
MRIGIIGIGSLTMELAFRSVRAGYKVKIHNPRGNSLVRDVFEKMGSNIQLSSMEQASDTEIVILFVPKEDLQQVILSMPDMSGKLIVHTSSLIFNPKLLLSGITNSMTYKTTASMLPEAHIVKLFNPVNLKRNTLINHNKDDKKIFFTGDHKDSRNCLRAFLKNIHFSPIDISGRLHLHNNGMNSKTGAAANFAAKAKGSF